MMQENIEPPYAEWHVRWFERGYLFSSTRSSVLEYGHN